MVLMAHREFKVFPGLMEQTERMEQTELMESMALTVHKARKVKQAHLGL
jgi:hypothetical protein